MRHQRRPQADPRSTLRRARSLFGNKLGLDGARALASALEKLVGLKELRCAANAARKPTPAQPSAALTVSTATTSDRTGRVRSHRRSRKWSG